MTTPENFEVSLWFGVWLTATRAAYKLAYGARSAELRGKRTKGFDDRGLHPYSEQWGRITLAEGFIATEWPFGSPPVLSPSSLKSMAEADAYRDFIKGLREESVNE